MQRGGRELYCLRDTQELSDKIAFLTPRQLAIASCFDGRSELHEVQASFSKRYDGLLVTAAEIEALIRQLDEIFFLESPRYQDRLDQVREALAEGAGLILLDNMGLADLRAAVAEARRYPGTRLEASGGLRLETARAVAETGVDFIAVGALTHSSPALDLGLDMAAPTVG